MFKNKKKSTARKTDPEYMLDCLIQTIQTNEKMTAQQKADKVNFINKLKEKLTEDDFKRAEEKYRRNVYKNVSYVQVPTLNENPEVATILTLEGAELKVYTLFERMMISQYVSLSLTDISEVTMLDKTTVSRALKSLREKKIIRVAIKATNREPAVYWVNSAIARSGKVKQALEEDIKSLRYFDDDDSLSLQKKQKTKKIPLTIEAIIEYIKSFHARHYVGLDKAFLDDGTTALYAKLKDPQEREKTK